jgi:uncharacterized protein DUF4440
MRVLFGLAVGLLATQLGAQTASDETAIRAIVQDESAAWNEGDAVAYSRHFAADGTFTNMTGQFFAGYDAFLKQHEVIFKGRFKQTRLQQDVVSLKFVRPILPWLKCSPLSLALLRRSWRRAPVPMPRGVCERGCCKLSVRQGEEWKIVTYHNVDVKPGIPIPEPR